MTIDEYKAALIAKFGRIEGVEAAENLLASWIKTNGADEPAPPEPVPPPVPESLIPEDT